MIRRPLELLRRASNTTLRQIVRATPRARALRLMCPSAGVDDLGPRPLSVRVASARKGEQSPTQTSWFFLGFPRTDDSCQRKKPKSRKAEKLKLSASRSLSFSVFSVTRSGQDVISVFQSFDFSSEASLYPTAPSHPGVYERALLKIMETVARQAISSA